MVVEAVVEKMTLGDVAEKIIADIQEEFPDAKCLINDEVYGEEDLDIEVYVDEDRVLAVDRFASELTYRYWEQTGYNIFAMVAPKECYPIKE
jgi:hypothetical protein